MVSARPFLFEQDFRRPAAPPEVDKAAEEAEHARRAAERAVREEAERVGYARGLAEGRAASAEDAEARLAAAADRLADGVARLLGTLEARARDAEAEAAAFFGPLAARAAGLALSADPIAPVREAALEAFRHLRGVPHLAVRVPEALVEPVEAMLRRLAGERGYEGRIIVLPDDEAEPGDARLDWADGGVVRNAAATRAAIANLLREAGLDASLLSDGPLP